MYRQLGQTGTGSKTASTGAKEPQHDSSSMRWSGQTPGSQWAPTWARGSTVSTPPPIPEPLQPPIAPSSGPPWGAIAAAVGSVVVIGGIVAITSSRRRQPRPNRRSRR